MGRTVSGSEPVPGVGVELFPFVSVHSAGWSVQTQLSPLVQVRVRCSACNLTCLVLSWGEPWKPPTFLRFHSFLTNAHSTYYCLSLSFHLHQALRGGFSTLKTLFRVLNASNCSFNFGFWDPLCLDFLHLQSQYPGLIGFFHRLSAEQPQR